MIKKEKPGINNTSEVQEAGTPYTRPRQITVFTSYSESEEVQYQHWASLSPEERLSEFFDIMSRFYVFIKPDWKGTRINIGQ